MTSRALRLAIMLTLGVFPQHASAQIVETVIQGVGGPGPGGTWRSGCDNVHRCFFTFPISITVQAEGWSSVISKCINNNLCEGVLEAVGAAFGLDPKTIHQITQIYAGNPEFSSSIPSPNERYLYFHLPPLERACAMYWNFYSISGGSSISSSFTTDRRRVDFYTNTPVKRAGAGQTWLKGFVEVYAHNSDTDSGCNAHKPDMVFNTNGGDPTHGGNVVDPFYPR